MCKATFNIKEKGSVQTSLCFEKNRQIRDYFYSLQNFKDKQQLLLTESSLFPAVDLQNPT